jgi:hypothetical protein
MRMICGVVLLAFAGGMAACDSSRASMPTAPTPVPQPVQQSTTIFVNGFVYDSAFRTLAGAIVEVLDGPQAGLSATADATGRFTLTGNFDDSTRFRASKEGHVDSIGTLTPRCATCSGARYIYFIVGVLAQPVEIAGEYRLTFIADGTCTDLPSELRTRTYNATITPVSNSRNPPNTSFQVAISGAQFLKGYESFPIGVAGDLVAFELRGEGPYLVEEVAPNTYIGFDGRAEASVGTSRVSTISASFQGWVDYCALKSPMGQYYECRAGLATARVECESKSHQLILTRR